MDEQKPSWEQEVINRCLVIALVAVLVALVGVGLSVLTNLACFAPLYAVGLIVAIAFGIFGGVGLVVEGW